MIAERDYQRWSESERDNRDVTFHGPFPTELAAQHFLEHKIAEVNRGRKIWVKYWSAGNRIQYEAVLSVDKPCEQSQGPMYNYRNAVEYAKARSNP